MVHGDKVEAWPRSINLLLQKSLWDILHLSRRQQKKTEQEAQVSFGSGAIAGHFYFDEMRFGSKCD